MAIKTIVQFGRNLTDEENNAIMEQILIVSAQGLTNRSLLVSNPENPELAVGTRFWATEEAANEWVAFLKTLVPELVSAVVEVS